MNTLFRHRALVRENLVSVIGICLCLYFAYHAIQGNRSLMRMMALESQISTLSLEHDSLLAERQKLETKVAMMRPGSLNRDLLEERARVVLGYKNQNDLVILDN